MKTTHAVIDLENALDYARGGIDLYRQGIDENYIPHGLAHVREKLEAARIDLEAIGLFEQFQELLIQVEKWVRQGPEHDAEADLLILDAQRALMRASGSHDTMRRALGTSSESEPATGMDSEDS